MKPPVLLEALHALIGQRVRLHIWGACGVGKSQIVAQVASDLNCQFLDVRAVQLDPGDLRGLPRITGGPGRVGAAQVPAHEREGASCFWTNTRPHRR